MHNVTEYFLYFMIYAFFGYICEVVYVAICTKKITNRGYLYGPLVPIYGYGAILILLSLSWSLEIDKWYTPFLVFLLGAVFTSILEYIVSYVMEVLFHMRWWDYSDKFGNLNGRICLRNSSMFGVLVVAVLYGLHPYVVTPFVNLISNFGNLWFYIISGLLFIAILIDTIFSTIKHINISKMIRKLEALALQAKEELNVAKTIVKDGMNSFKENANEKLEELKEYLLNTKVVKTIQAAAKHYPSARIRPEKKHPRLTFTEYFDKLKDKIKGEE